MAALAFIDLLATKDSALVGEGEFHSAMSRFHKTLIDNRSLLGDGAKLRHFADCCYIEASSVSSLLAFLRHVRFFLFVNRHFFKCSVGLGELNETSIDQMLGSENPQQSVSGTVFGKDVAEIYLAVERFKGVGITIDKRAVSQLSEAERDEYICQSAYFPSDEDSRIEEYFDIRLVENDLDEGGDFVEEIVQAIGEAKSLKPKYAKYYFPALMLWINSFPVSKDHIFEDDDEQEDIKKRFSFEGGQKIYRFFFLNRENSFNKKFGDMPQYSSLYLALLQKFIASGIEEYPLEGIIRKLPAPSKVFRDTSRVPTFVISTSNKKLVTRIHSKVRI